MPASLLRRCLAKHNMAEAWQRVYDNHGGPGVDGITVDAVHPHWPEQLPQLVRDVLAQRYRPQPLRECLIPKSTANDSPLAQASPEPPRMRRLAIPTVHDRWLQTAVALQLTPILEREFADSSFAYRQGRSVQQAIARVKRLRDEGYQWVVDADIEAFFDNIDHDDLMHALRPLVPDAGLCKLIQLWLVVPVLSADGQLQLRARGVAQGSPLSPLLSNLYLDTLDDAMLDAQHRIVRFADDFVILCRSQDQARNALQLSRDVLESLALRLNSEKTRIVDFNQGFKFLGVNFVRSLAVPASNNRNKPVAGTHQHMQRLKKWEEQNSLPPEAQALVSATKTHATRWHEPLPEGPMQAAMRESNAHSLALPTAPLITPESTLRTLPVLRTLYLLEQGAIVTRDGDQLQVLHEQEVLANVGLPQLDLVLVLGNIGVTTPALQTCLSLQIPLVFMARTGKLYGVAHGANAVSATVLRAQVLTSSFEHQRLELARAMVHAKIINSRTLLKRWHKNRIGHPAQAQLHQASLTLRDAAWRCKTANNLDTLRGLEGAAAANYFAATRALIPEQWGFGPRIAYSPPDPVNALLTFGYSLLRANLLAMVCAEGLSPYVGFLHADGHNHAALVSDLMEEFRALVVDALVMDLIAHRRLKPEDFHTTEPEPELEEAWTAQEMTKPKQTEAERAARPQPNAKPSQSLCRLTSQASRLFIHELEARMQAAIRVRTEYGQREPVSMRHLMLTQVKKLSLALRQGTRYVPWIGR